MAKPSPYTGKVYVIGYKAFPLSEYVRSGSPARGVNFTIHLELAKRYTYNGAKAAARALNKYYSTSKFLVSFIPSRQKEA